MDIFEIETAEFELLKEDKKKRKLFKSPIMKAGWLNKNGRIYPKAVVKKMVTKAKEQIKSNRLYGSSFHPKDGFGDAHNVAWIMRDLAMEGDQVVVTGELLDTTKGKDLQVILQAGGSLGLSVRGHGDSKDAKFKTSKGEIDCQEIISFELSGCDVVLNPSFDTQFSKSDMFESVGLVELENEDNVIVAEREDMKKSFRKIFDQKQDAGEISLEETFEGWLQDEGLPDEEIDRLIREDRESEKSNDLFNFEQALLSGYEKNFDTWKSEQKLSEDADEELIRLFDEAVSSGYRGDFEAFKKARNK